MSFATQVQHMYDRLPVDDRLPANDMQHQLHAILMKIQFGMHKKSSFETYQWLTKGLMKNKPTPEQLVNACTHNYMGGPLRWPVNVDLLSSDRYDDQYIMHIITISEKAKRKRDYHLYKRAVAWLKE